MASLGQLFKWFDYVLIVAFAYYAIAYDNWLAWVLAAFVALRRVYTKTIGSDTINYHLVDCKHRHRLDDTHRHHTGELEAVKKGGRSYPPPL